MGRISNSIGVRLGKVINWQNNVYLSKSYFCIDIWFVLQYINSFFLRKDIMQYDILLSHTVINQTKNDYNITLFLYDARVLNYRKKRKSLRIAYSVMFLAIERSLLEDLRFIIRKNVNVEFKMLSNYNITAKLIAVYLRLKLKQGFSLGNILQPLTKYLIKVPFLKGFRISCSGRFTRKQRASFLSIQRGSVPFSTLDNIVEYSEDAVILKFGKCGIKVWLNKTERLEPYRVKILKSGDAYS